MAACRFGSGSRRAMKTQALQALALVCTLAPALASAAAAAAGTCSSPGPVQHDYSKVFAPHHGVSLDLTDLPGFTRSSYQRDHALITPESRVFAGQPGWTKTVTAHLISPGSGRANFAMFLANVSAGGAAPPAPAPEVERFVLVLEGEAAVTHEDGRQDVLGSNSYAYFPPGSAARLSTSSGVGLVVWERKYSLPQGKPVYQTGYVDDSPLLPVAGEVFELRKLLPQTADYDFNIHIMDFKPGEFLNVKEIHYNQHGLLLLEGRGIYRLGDAWYPVQAGDAIWMAPYVIQWYAALGTTRSRYVINKDTIVDPLLS